MIPTKVDANNFIVAAPCFEVRVLERVVARGHGHQILVKRGASWADGQFLSPWSMAMIHHSRDNCCVTLLIGTDKSWLFSGQLRLVSSNGQQNTHLCCKWTGASRSIHSATGPVSVWWSNDGPGGGQHPLQLTWTEPLPVASLCVMEALWPLTTVSWTTGASNLQVTQWRWRETLLMSSEPVRFSFHIHLCTTISSFFSNARDVLLTRGTSVPSSL